MGGAEMNLQGHHPALLESRRAGLSGAEPQSARLKAAAMKGPQRPAFRLHAEAPGMCPDPVGQGGMPFFFGHQKKNAQNAQRGSNRPAIMLLPRVSCLLGDAMSWCWFKPASREEKQGHPSPVLMRPRMPLGMRDIRWLWFCRGLFSFFLGCRASSRCLFLGRPETRVVGCKLL